MTFTRHSHVMFEPVQRQRTNQLSNGGVVTGLRPGKIQGMGGAQGFVHMEECQPSEIHVPVITPGKMSPLSQVPYSSAESTCLRVVSSVCSLPGLAEGTVSPAPIKCPAEVEKPSMGMSRSDCWNTRSFSRHSGDHKSLASPSHPLPAIVLLPSRTGGGGVRSVRAHSSLAAGNSLSRLPASPDSQAPERFGNDGMLWSILKTFTANCSCSLNTLHVMLTASA